MVSDPDGTLSGFLVGGGVPVETKLAGDSLIARRTVISVNGDVTDFILAGTADDRALNNRHRQRVGDALVSLTTSVEGWSDRAKRLAAVVAFIMRRRRVIAFGAIGVGALSTGGLSLFAESALLNLVPAAVGGVAASASELVRAYFRAKGRERLQKLISQGQAELAAAEQPTKDELLPH